MTGVPFGRRSPRKRGPYSTPINNHVYRNAYGKGNHIVQDVYVLSHFRIDGVSRVRFNGEWKTLGGTEDSDKGFRIQGIDAEVWVKVYVGTMNQAADAALIANSNPAGRWTEDHRGAGVAYAIVTSVLDREHLPNPWEAFFEVKGAPLYDWRKDSTVGGTGSHRWDDQDTWEFDPKHNPVLMMYALERGIFNGTEKMVGKGISPSKLPLSRWTIAANIAEEAASGGTRYQASCIATSGPNRTHENNMAPLREACAASWVELVDGEYPIVGAEQAVVATFTDDDLVVGQPYRYSAKRTRSELVNTVAGSFIDPGNFYQSVPFSTRIDAAAQSEDGERLAASIPYGAVTEPKCVDRLADIAIRASRYQASAEIWLRPKFLTLRSGDWVKWASARNGTKTFQVLSKQLGPFGSDNCRNVHVSLQEVSAGVFDPTAYVTVPPDGAIQGNPDFLAEVQNFIVAGIPVEVDDNSMPALRGTWNAIDDPTVTGVEVKWWPTEQPENAISVTIPRDQTVFVTLNVVASTEYQVSTRLVTRPYRVTVWSDPKPATTPASGYALFPIDLDDLDDDVHDKFDEIDETLATNVADIGKRRGDIADLAARVMGLQATDYLGRKDLRRSLSEDVGDAKAEFDERIVLLVDADQALALRVDSLTASYRSASAAITSESEARATADTALGQQIQAVEAGVGDVLAGGYLKLTADTSPSGALAQVDLAVRASVGGTVGRAAISLQAYSDGGTIRTRALHIADETYFVDGSGNMANVIAFSGGVAYLPDLRIGRLRSFNGKLDIQGLGSNASIEVWS